jgi:hypothetical protein
VNVSKNPLPADTLTGGLSYILAVTGGGDDLNAVKQILEGGSYAKYKLTSYIAGFPSSLSEDGTTTSQLTIRVWVHPYTSAVTLCTLTVLAGTGGTVSRATITDTLGDVVKDTATANANYTFAKWTRNNTNAVPADSASRFGSWTLNGSATVTANFTFSGCVSKIYRTTGGTIRRITK